MADKKKRIQITTPPGTLVYPKLNRINYGTDKYPVENGNFETGIIFDVTHPEFAAFEAKLAPLYDEARTTAEELYKALPIDARKKLSGIALDEKLAKMYDPKTEELLPTVKMKVAMMQGGVIKNGPKKGQEWMNRPKAFDAAGKPIPLFYDAPGKPHHGKPIASAPQIWGGTIARLAVEVDTNKDGSIGYFVAATGKYGIRLSLRAVQIISLASAPQASADQFGFGQESGGFNFDGDSFSMDEPPVEEETNSDAPSTDNATTEAAKVSGNF
jgi:hypothetical protein